MEERERVRASRFRRHRRINRVDTNGNVLQTIESADAFRRNVRVPTKCYASNLTYRLGVYIYHRRDDCIGVRSRRVEGEAGSGDAPNCKVANSLSFVLTSPSFLRYSLFGPENDQLYFLGL
jgi:hypothetical protein